MTSKQTPFIITVDIGASHARFALFSAQKILSHKETFHTKNYKNGIHNTQTLQKTLRAFCKKHQQKNIVATSVSVAGPLIPHKGAFHPSTLASNVIEIVKPFSHITHRETFLLNDAAAAVYGVHHHEYPHKKHIAYITISTGIGVGAVVDGHLLQGRDGSAGELGHAIVYSPYTDGAHSWEHYIAGHRKSTKGIIRFYQKWALAHNNGINQSYKTPKDLFSAHHKHAPDITGFMDAVGNINAQGVANVMYAYNPEIIVFGGSIAYHNYDIIIRGIRAHIRRDLITPLPQFKRTKLGDDVALIGAGEWGFYKLSQTQQ